MWAGPRRGRGCADVSSCGPRRVQAGAGLAPRAGPRGVGRRHLHLRAARASAWAPLLPLAAGAHRVSVRAAEGQARGLTQARTAGQVGYLSRRSGRPARRMDPSDSSQCSHLACQGFTL